MGWAPEPGEVGTMALSPKCVRGKMSILSDVHFT